MNESEDQVPQSRKLPKLLKRIIIFFILFVLAASAAAYFYYQNLSAKNNPDKAGEEEIYDIISRVGKLIILPENETPTVATVKDADSLKDQPFFATAKNGYKILIYTQAKKAILYDPEANILVEVAPLNIDK